MPLKNTNETIPKKNLDYKARLEKKLCLAKETPEPVFDLSDCNLKILPNDIFSLCKLYRKKALYLQNNVLSSLCSGGSLEDLIDLNILNLSKNKFTELTPHINILNNLEILDVSENNLSTIPSEIGSLQNLKYLNITDNNLQFLPNSIGNCKSLEILLLKSNQPLKELPLTLGKLKLLRELEIDSEFMYPPADVCQQGIDGIMKFFNKELYGQIQNPSTSKKVDIGNNSINEKKLQIQLEQLYKLREEKQMQQLAIEQNLVNENQKERELQKELIDKKQKLLVDIKTEQENLDKKLQQIQQQKNIDHQLLIKSCLEEEERSNEAIKKILANNKKAQLIILNIDEGIRLEEDKRLKSLISEEDKALLKQKILISMNETVREEIKRHQSYCSGRRVCNTHSIAFEINRENLNIMELLKKNEENQTHLVKTILFNEEIQKSAVASLLERSDAGYWELKQKIYIIETKLSELTRLELYRKKLQTESRIAELSENRIALTNVLMQLLDERIKRREQLLEKIRQMESNKLVVKDSENYWFEQYEKLLHSKSRETVNFLEAINPALLYKFFVYGVLHYLPLLGDIVFSQEELEKLNPNHLSKLAINNANDRMNILNAVGSFLSLNLSTPSAPLEPKFTSEETKIDNYMSSEECVICLDAKPNVIFVPCGHICCCYKCFTSIALCPICRTPIDQAPGTTFPD